jgi:glycosyltransferase involved in cell wall biosynthesis
LGNKVTLVLDVDEETFRRCVENTKNQSTNSSQLEFRLLSKIVSQEAAPRDSFPSDAHWKSYQFSLAAESIHSKTPIDVLEFVDYCGPAYYTLLKRAAIPRSLPRNIVVRMHNTIELIDRCASSNFARSRLFDYGLERAAIAMADRILSPGFLYWRDVAARLYSVPAERVITSPPCRTLLPRLADGISGRNIVFVGRISTIKGMDLFLQAMAEICTDAMLAASFDQIRVIGPSESVSSQNEEAILNYKRGIPQEKIQFLGNLSESDLIHELAHAQFAVFPNRCESFCYAAHEAHMLGVPLVLSSIPAFLDHFVEGKSALFFNGTHHNLTSRIRELLVDSDLRTRLSSSVLAHRVRYESVTYGADLDDESSASSRVSAAVLESPQTNAVSDGDDELSVVFFCQNIHRTDAYEHVKRLLPQTCNADVIVLIESESEGQGTIHAFGQHWEFADSGRSPIEQLDAGLILLLSDSYTLTSSFVERGIGMMARMPMIGAILPVALKGRWGAAEFGSAADLFTLRVGEQPQGFPLLVRLANQTPLQQLLHDSSPYTALTLLIELRGAGLAIVDDIQPTLACHADSHSFPLPGRSDVSAFVKQNLLRYRDYELASNLVDEVQTLPALADEEQDSHGTTRRVLQDLHQGLVDALYLHVVEGSAVVLSIVDPAVGRELNWQDLHLYGPYQITEAKDRPSAILVLKEGCCLRVDGGVRLVFNLALGPAGGRLAMIANNRCVMLSTEHKDFSHRSFIPNDLLEIAANQRFELPSRVYHLAAYHRKPITNRLPTALCPNLKSSVDCCLFTENLSCISFSLPAALACSHTAQLERAGKDDAILVDEIATYVHSLEITTACFIDFGWIEIATRLLEDFKTIRVDFIISPIAIWSPTIALGLLDIGNLVNRFRDRVGILHPPALIGYFPAFRTVRLYSLPQFFEAVPAQAPSANAPVQIIIDHNPRNEFYMGHMAAVAKILQANAILIDEISIPSGQASQDRLFESFGLSHLLRHYKKIDAHTARVDRQIVYLNPFPFGENIVNLSNALRLGWHTVISYYENNLLGHVNCERAHIIEYWEDVEIISQHILDSIRNLKNVRSSINI